MTTDASSSKSSLTGFVRFMVSSHKLVLVALAVLTVAIAVAAVLYAQTHPVSAAISTCAALYAITKAPWAWYQKNLAA
jgi:uncharacterized membrane protein YqjE